MTADGLQKTTARRGRAVELAVILDLASVGGIEVLFRNLFSSFDPAVVRPRLLCLREAGPLADEFRAAGFSVEVVTRSGPKGIVRLPRLVAALRRHRVDAVLIAHHHRASLMFGLLAAKLARVPATVVVAQDMDLISLGKRVFPRWAVESLWLADALVLVAPSQGRYLHAEEGVGRHRWSSVREIVIANGIIAGSPPDGSDRARARATLGLEEDDFVVGVVARLSPQKAHHFMLEAIAVLARRHPHVRLVALGDGERRQELERLADSLGIADRVLFAGVRRDVAELLPAFDVSSLSSIHEAMPLALIESMAACLPVVATDCGAVRDVVTDGETGYVVSVGDVAALADRLAVLVENPELRERLGANGRARVMRDFTIEGTARRYEALLTDIVSANGRK